MMLNKDICIMAHVFFILPFWLLCIIYSGSASLGWEQEQTSKEAHALEILFCQSSSEIPAGIPHMASSLKTRTLYL